MVSSETHLKLQGELDLILFSVKDNTDTNFQILFCRSYMIIFVNLIFVHWSLHVLDPKL